MSNPNEVTINLHKYQDEAIFSTNKFIAAIAGIQSGKTIAGAIWVNKKLSECKGDGVVMANDYKMLDQSTLPKLFEINPVLKKFYKQQRGIIELPTGQRIYIRSAENPNSVEGFTAEWAWLDEAGKYKYDAWVNIQARLAIKQGQAFITTTPDAMNWLYHDFYKRALKHDPDYKVVQWRSIDNPFFTQEEYDRAKRNLAPATFRRRYEGTFESMEGLVYNLTQDQIIEPREIAAKDCICGVDFGWNNPMAASIIKYSHDGIFYIVDEIYKTEMSDDELIEQLHALRKEHNITKFYPDSEDSGKIAKMKQKGLYIRDVRKGKGSVVTGISEVNNLLFQGKLKIFNTCKHHLDEFNTYQYDEPFEEKNQKELPRPFNDHLMDAMRYCLTTFSYVPPRPKINRYIPSNPRTGY